MLVVALVRARGPPVTRATPARYKLLSGPPWGGDKMTNPHECGKKEAGPSGTIYKSGRVSPQPRLRTRAGTAKVTTRKLAKSTPPDGGSIGSPQQRQRRGRCLGRLRGQKPKSFETNFGFQIGTVLPSFLGHGDRVSDFGLTIRPVQLSGTTSRRLGSGSEARTFQRLGCAISWRSPAQTPHQR